MIQQPAGGQFINRSNWNNASAYKPFDYAQNAGVPCLCVAAVAASGGASTPSIDPSGTFQTLGGTNLSSIAVAAVAMTNAGLLMALVCMQGNVTVTGVADTDGLAWTKRWAENFSGAGDVELWTAPVSAGFTGDTVTFTLSGAAGGNNSTSAFAWGLNNENGFDSDSGLPFTSNGTTVINAATAEAPDLGFYVGVCPNTNSTPGVPTGFASLISAQNGNGLNFMSMRVATQALASSGAVVVTPTGGNSSNLNVFDALTNNGGGGNPAPPSDPTHWLVGA
jgi:hypothetical protein